MKQLGDSGDLREALSAAGLRYTAQREAVYEYLRSVHNHPTAEEVYQAVRRRIPRISLATVYTCLEALVACGKATKLANGDGPARYDHRTDLHYHLRDLRTGEVRDLELPQPISLPEQLQTQLADLFRQHGFRLAEVRLEFLGYFDRPGNGSPSPPGLNSH
jgi:Fur family peroxide stress response transcriptional regulator